MVTIFQKHHRAFSYPSTILLTYCLWIRSQSAVLRLFHSRVLRGKPTRNQTLQLHPHSSPRRWTKLLLKLSVGVTEQEEKAHQCALLPSCHLFNSTAPRNQSLCHCVLQRGKLIKSILHNKLSRNVSGVLWGNGDAGLQKVSVP